MDTKKKRKVVKRKEESEAASFSASLNKPKQRKKRSTSNLVDLKRDHLGVRIYKATKKQIRNKSYSTSSSNNIPPVEIEDIDYVCKYKQLESIYPITVT